MNQPYEDHKTVAIFCGWEPQKPTKGLPHGYLQLKDDENDEVVYYSKILEELPYGTDWNYLLIAYNLFREEAEKQDDDGYTISDEAMKIRDSLIGAILDVDITLAFKELVRGIELVNQLKLQEHEN